MSKHNIRYHFPYSSTTQFVLGNPRRPWVRADRRWFRKHRKRSHRLRKAFPGEIAELYGEEIPNSDWIIVRQLEPGIRKRLAMWFEKPPPLGIIDSPAMEHYLHAGFDLLISAGGSVPMSEIAALAKRYAESGGRAQ